MWLDTEGKRIQAHGGSIMYTNGKYYLYGENKEKNTARKRSVALGSKALFIRRFV
ncbi:MAG: hypothetical protein L6V93_13110 [Clostridiales bacterium]|nr:MAG: hypothetical protein L6V93_13110 [Clostridiales bacterium]